LVDSRINSYTVRPNGDIIVSLACDAPYEAIGCGIDTNQKFYIRATKKQGEDYISDVSISPSNRYQALHSLDEWLLVYQHSSTISEFWSYSADYGNIGSQGESIRHAIPIDSNISIDRKHLIYHYQEKDHLGRTIGSVCRHRVDTGNDKNCTSLPAPLAGGSYNGGASSVAEVSLMLTTNNPSLSVEQTQEWGFDDEKMLDVLLDSESFSSTAFFGDEWSFNIEDVTVGEYREIYHDIYRNIRASSHMYTAPDSIYVVFVITGCKLYTDSTYCQHDAGRTTSRVIYLAKYDYALNNIYTKALATGDYLYPYFITGNEGKKVYVGLRTHEGNGYTNDVLFATSGNVSLTGSSPNIILDISPSGSFTYVITTKDYGFGGLNVEYLPFEDKLIGIYVEGTSFYSQLFSLSNESILIQDSPSLVHTVASIENTSVAEIRPIRKALENNVYFGWNEQDNNQNTYPKVKKIK
jgi:hypothetical protein